MKKGELGVVLVLIVFILTFSFLNLSSTQTPSGLQVADVQELQSSNDEGRGTLESRSIQVACTSCADCTTCASTIGNTCTLSNSMFSPAECITVTANSVTIDCNGFMIGFANATDTVTGIDAANVQGITVQNCRINHTNTTLTSLVQAIRLTAHANASIVNTTFFMNATAITGTYTNASFINNTFFLNESTGISGSGNGIVIQGNIFNVSSSATSVSLSNSVSVTIHNNTFSKSSVTNPQIQFTSLRESLVSNNTLSSTGNANGISVTTTNNTNFTNNTVLQGGISLGGSNLSVTNNILRPGASGDAWFHSSGTFNSRNNTITGSTRFNNIVSNSSSLNDTFNGRVTVLGANISFVNSTFNGSTTGALYTTFVSSRLTIANATVRASTTAPAMSINGTNHTLTNMRVITQTAPIIRFNATQNTLLSTIYFETNGSWINATATSNISFLNTTFNDTNGSIHFFEFNLSNDAIINQSHFNITENLTFVNSTNFSFLNTTAQITLRGLNFTNPQPLIDIEDDGTFALCNPPDCVEDSYAGGAFVLNVTHFTSHSSRETQSNSHPSIAQVILNSTDGSGAAGNNATTDENLTVVIINATDADSDPVQNITDWRLNGTSIAVLNLPFETNTSSTQSGAVRDYSTFVNNGTLGNGNSLAVPVWNVSGRAGGAFTFDGINDTIQIANSSSIEFGIGDFSVCAWMRTSSLNGGIVTKRNDTIDPFLGWYLRIVSGRSEFDIYDSSDPYPSNTFGVFAYSNVSDNAWHFICGVADRDVNASIYIDGIVRNSSSITGSAGSVNSNSSLVIGNQVENNFPFNGSVDEVFVTNRVISAAQIYQLYLDGNSSRHMTTLHFNETTVGQNWSVAVTPNDNQNGSDGTTRFTNNVTVLSAHPSIGQVILNSTDGSGAAGNNATTDENLTVVIINATDADSDPVQNITDWRLNGTSIAVLNLPFETNVSVNTSGAVRDYSVFGSNGTLGNGTSSASWPVWNSSGRAGGAYTFDDFDLITFGDASQLDFIGGFSIEAWVRTTQSLGALNYAAISGKGYLQSGVNGYGLFLNGDEPGSNVTFQVRNDTNTVNVVGPAVNDGSWHQVIGVRNHSNDLSLLYVDGMLRGTASGSVINYSNAVEFTVGGRHSIGSLPLPYAWFFNGSVDEVRVYNRSLSAAQIYRLYLDGNNSRHMETLHFNETTVGQNWSVAVTPNDNQPNTDGSTVLSNNITILDEGQACPLNVNSSTTLTQNVTCPATAVNILASNTVFDCNGFSINYSGINEGSGVNISGFNNVTVKNCIIYQGNTSVSNSDAVSIVSSNNASVLNSSLNATGPSSKAIDTSSTVDLFVANSSLESNLSVALVLSFTTSSVVRNVSIFGDFAVQDSFGQRTLLDNISARCISGSALQLGTVSNFSIRNSNVLCNGGNPGINFQVGYDSVLNNVTITATTGTGVNIANARNITVANSSISDYLAQSSTLLFIKNVTANESGTFFNAGNGTIDNSTFFSGSFIGLSLTNASNVTVSNSSMTGSSRGLRLTTESHNITVVDSVVSGGSNTAIDVIDGASNSTFQRVQANVSSGSPAVILAGQRINFMQSNATNAGAGLGIRVNASNALISHSVAIGGSAGAILLNLSHNSSVINTSARASSGSALQLINTSETNVTNGTLISDTGSALALQTSAQNNVFSTTVLNTNSTWLSTDAGSSGNNITNTTFDVPTNGSIRFPQNIVVPVSSTVNKAKLNISTNISVLNSSNLSFLNVSAQVTLRGLSFTDPRPLVDFEDDGTFALCSAPQCVEDSYNGSTFVFNVSSFTTYSTQESPFCPLNITTSTTLTENVTCPATAIQIQADNVTLDCNGFTINYSTVSIGAGINMTSRTNVTAQNCIVVKGAPFVNGSSAVVLDSSVNVTLRNISVNVTDGIDSHAVVGTAVTRALIERSVLESNSSHAVFLTSSTGSRVRNSTVESNSSDGVRLAAGSGNEVSNSSVRSVQRAAIRFSSSTGNIAANNTLAAIGPTILAIGIDSNGANNVFSNNSISSSGGAGISAGGSNVSVVLNVVNVSGGDSGVVVSGTGHGVNVSHNAVTSNNTVALNIGGSNNFAFNNTLTSLALSGSGTGVSIVDSTNNTLIDNVGSSGGTNAALRLLRAYNNTIRGFVAVNVVGGGLESGLFGGGVSLQDSNNNTFVNVTAISNKSGALRFDSAANTSFDGLIIESNISWISISGASVNLSLANTTFRSIAGSIFFVDNRTHPASTSTTLALLNITANRSFLNSSSLSFLNTSARITLHNLSFSDPRPLVDFEDDGTFAVCSPPQCVEESYNGSTAVFNVSSFTSYATQESPFCPLNITTSTTLTENVTCPATAIQILANNLVLDCNGFTITHDTGGTGGDGITASNRNNVTVRNCNTIDGNSSGLNGVGIFFTTVTNSTITNNTIQTNGTDTNYGVTLQTSANNNTVANNTINTNGANSNYGVYLFNTLSANLIVNNTIRTNGTNGNIGIRLETAANNNTVRANVIVTQGTGINNPGMHLVSSVSGNTVVNNSIRTNGTGSNSGIFLQSSANNNTIANNTIQTNGTAASNVGIHLLTTNSGNLIENNTISTNGTSSNSGFHIQDSTNNTIRGNTIYTQGTSSGNSGVFLFTTVSGNIISNNTIMTNGTSLNAGIRLQTSVSNNTITNNSISSSGTTTDNYGIYLSTSVTENQIFNNIVSTNGTTDNHGIRLESSANNNSFLSNTISTRGTTSHGISIANSNSSTFNETTLNDPVEWISTNANTNNSFLNTTFNMTNGSIKVFSFSLVNSTSIIHSRLNITLNRSFINSSNLSFLNTSAQITLRNLSFTDPRPVVDFEDDGTFALCSSPQCVEQSYSGGVFVFNVSSFTSYAVAETGNINLSVTKSDAPDPVNNGSTLSYIIMINNSGTDTATNVTLRENYPANTTFNGSSPAPSSGNNFFFLGNLTGGSSITINITVNVSENMTSGTLNNTINVSFLNTTGANITVNVSELTSVTTLGAPTPLPSGSGGGGGTVIFRNAQINTTPQQVLPPVVQQAAPVQASPAKEVILPEPILAPEPITAPKAEPQSIPLPETRSETVIWPVLALIALALVVLIAVTRRGHPARPRGIRMHTLENDIKELKKQIDETNRILKHKIK